MERLNRIGYELMTIATPRNVEREDGQTMAEYALILTAVAVVVFAAAGLLGTQISTAFDGIRTSLGG